VPIAKDSIAGRSGEPISLRGWQREMLRHALARREDGRFAHSVYLIGIARKNGKTSLASVLPLFFGLYGDHGGEIYSASATRDQARLVMAHAKRAVEMQPEFAGRIRVYRDALEFTETGTTYRALSSEAYSKEGLSATLVIADELAAWPSRDLFDVLSLSMGARRSPLMVAITTAGTRTDATGTDSIAFTLYQLARRRIAGEHDDTTLGMAWYEAGEGAYRDPTRWHEANPALLSTPPILSRDDLESAYKRTPEGEFRIKRLNEFVAADTAWLPAGAWDACTDATLALQPHDQIVIGYDGSFASDSTAIVACRTSDGALFVIGHWERPLDDAHWRVPIEEVEQRMLDLAMMYDVIEVCCDPFRWQRSMEVWRSNGLPVVEFNQTPQRMVPATAAVYDAVIQSRLRHDGDPRLTRHIANATPHYSRHGVMLRKGRESNKKIDLAVAAIMAWSRAMTISTPPAVQPAPPVSLISL
jgi:phage terminase large subunit-like protein